MTLVLASGTLVSGELSKPALISTIHSFDTTSSISGKVTILKAATF